ncbi:hypothetical protein BHE74_00011722 [Ensete ventricosum]|nr:hypothetical protein BHE74_00011722 [Ensete ventricosum]
MTACLCSPELGLRLDPADPLPLACFLDLSIESHSDAAMGGGGPQTGLDFHLWAIVIATRNRTPDEYTIHLRSRNHIKILEFDLSAFISSDRNLGDDAHFDAGSVVPYVPDAVTESPVRSICSSPVTSSSLPCKRSEQLKQTGNLTVVLRALM